MSKKPKDQHPDVPAEANKDNHVHFLGRKVRYRSA